MGLMDTLGRIPKILESNVNALLDKCEDPAKMIDQMLIDYKRNLVDVKRDTAEVKANLSMTKDKVAKMEKEVQRKTVAAQTALKVGKENDARAILQSRQQLETSLEELKQLQAQQQKDADELEAGYRKLVNDINLLESRKDTAKAKLSHAKAKKSRSKANAIARGSNIEDAFAKYEQRADRELAEAEAMLELDNSVSTADELTDLYAGGSYGDSSVDDELAAMKAQMGL